MKHSPLFLAALLLLPLSTGFSQTPETPPAPLPALNPLQQSVQRSLAQMAGADSAVGKTVANY